MCLGVPGQIVEIVDAEMRRAMADFSGVRREVNVACVLDDGDEADDLIGAWVLVHVGFAMNRISERQASETLAVLAELAEFQDEMEMMAANHGG